MSERFKFLCAVHLFLRQDNKILLLRRFNTGWMDGNYSVVAGHLDGNETVINAMRREAMEEAGITINEEDLKVIHVMHRKSDDERIDFFLECSKWEGEIKNCEVDKCDDLTWFEINKLPENIIPYIKSAIENYQKGIDFSEFNFN